MKNWKVKKMKSKVKQLNEKKLYAVKYGPLAKWPGCLQFLGEEELVLEEYTVHSNVKISDDRHTTVRTQYVPS